MEKGKSAGSYVLYLLRECFFRMKTELLGWRGLVLLVIAAYILMDTFAAVKETENLMAQGVAALWMVVIFPPRMGKLLYLLPFTQKERARYLRTYSVSYNVFYVMLFFVMGLVACLVSGYSFLLWMRHFVLCTFPFLLLYSGVTVHGMATMGQRSYPDSGWFFSTRQWWHQPADTVAGIKEDCGAAMAGKATLSEEERAKKKKESRFWGAVVVCMIIPVIHGCGNYMYMGLCSRWPWFLYSVSVLAYLSAFAGLYLYWIRISKELNKTGSTGKEEGVCSL